MSGVRVGGTTVYNGDCLDVMTTLAMVGTQVESIVTDPPYHLSTVKRFASGAPAQYGTDGLYQRASRGFMGKEWDGGDIAFQPETWRRCYDLLKPGGYLVAFSGSRTYHRMACAIEDAGFEIRDQLMWLYGTGFPKSHDVTKAIDKMDATDARRERQLRFTAWIRSVGLSSALINTITGTNMGGHYTTHPSQPAVATREYFEKLRPYIVAPVPDWVERLVDERTVESENYKRREVIGQQTNAMSGWDMDGGTQRAGRNITAPATDAAREWDGWGTALKPAHEPIVMARKPLIGTVVANVLAHGTGAINIDACRVNPGEAIPGRFPANVLHDGSDEVLEAFAVYGERASGSRNGQKKASVSFGENGTFAERERDTGYYREGDSGTAARFFYCAKASKHDRAGSKHPTVKPVALIEYLCRMVTRPGGTVLDPFAGSGTLADAWHNSILIEREQEYFIDIMGRLARRKGNTDAV